MKILALDTATAACSVAAWDDAEVVERFELVEHGHSERLLPLVDEVLAEVGWGLSQCDALAFGRGPGSFTALRIGAGVTQGLAFGADLPVVPVSSLAALAQGQDATRVLAAFDARMSQMYWAAYVRNTKGLVELAGQERVTSPVDLVLEGDETWLGVGNGWIAYRQVLPQAVEEAVEINDICLYPHAREVAVLAVGPVEAGETVGAEEAVPQYIRNNVAQKRGQ
ncbi:MAG: tRNA (adenosine(37)-N6)-threonylcarbamoyltransferase complex dimerization subunit type 1 TsaB [Gammaproteobacteria bacterium]|nr:tRNA (adenosine(37)-N6)-threonylcarbamoyltransferase complex dimerization subunit type 1 TsaB [Gammaproteobacteria bacterium]